MLKKKKIVAVLTLVCFLFTANVVWASGGSLNSGEKKQLRENQITFRDQDQKKAKVVQKWNEANKPLIQEIHKNNVEIIQLRNKMIQLRREIAGILKNVKEDDTALTDEQLQNLKDYLAELKVNKAEIKQELGSIKKEVVGLRIAKKEGKTGDAVDSLNSIIEKQEARIELLKDTIADLQKIIDTFPVTEQDNSGQDQDDQAQNGDGTQD